MTKLKPTAIYIKYIGSLFLKHLIYSVLFIFLLCAIAHFIPEKSIGFYIISTLCVSAATIIIVLWKIDASFKDLNDSLLFFYASYLAINKIISPNDTFLKVPNNVSFSELFYGSNKIEYLNLLVLFLVAICTIGKAIIAYRTFKSTYIEKL